MIGRMVLASVLLMGLVNTALATMQVEVSGAVSHPGRLELKEDARLSDAALAAKVQPRAYLLGAAWLQPGLVTAQTRLKAGITFDLAQLALRALQHGHRPLAETAGALRTWVNHLPVTGRTPALLAPRAVEVTADANWPLHPGDRLFYPVRPTTIRIVGAVQQACSVPLRPLQDARDYLSDCPKVPHAADPDWIYVIQPDGQVFRRGVAMWNRSPSMPLAPGALIYIPLPERAARVIDPDLNREVADFLATQVLPGPGAAP